MYPEILKLSFLHTYGVLVAVAFLMALWLAGRLAREAGLNADAVTNLGIYCALAAIAGAKIMMFLIDIPYSHSIRGKSFLFPHCRQAACFTAGCWLRWQWRSGTCGRPGFRVGRRPTSLHPPLRWVTGSAGSVVSQRAAVGVWSATVRGL